jgi:acyl dehydratase
VPDITTRVHIGDRFSREHRFTPQQVMEFSLAAGDDNPLHLDPVHAAASPYGVLIVSGTHTSALLFGLTASYFSKITSVVGRRFTVRFKRAVRADAAVTIEWRVVGLSPREGRPGHVVQLDGDLRETATGEVCVSATGEVVIGL